MPLHRLILNAVIVSQLAYGLVVPAPSAAQQSSYSDVEVSALFKDMASEASRIGKNIDRSEFDLRYLIESLGYDAEHITRFVREEIRLEIYDGALRGARGTLISRAGNSLDQSILAATLLRDAGYETRIHRGTLSHPEAEKVVDAMIDSHYSMLSSDGDADGRTATVSPPSVFDGLIASSKSNSDRIIAALEREHLTMGSADSLRQLYEEASDYYWITYRDGPTGRWSAVHVVDGVRPDAVTLATYTAEVPSELAHQISIVVSVVQRLGQSIHESQLIDPIELSGPNLVGNPLSITFLPDQLFNPEQRLNVDSVANSTQFIVPIVNGQLPPGAKAMSLRGMLVPADNIGMGAGGVFETLSEKGSQVIDALSSIDAQSSESATEVSIVALRLRMDINNANGQSKTIVRDLFNRQRDLSDPADSADRDRNSLVTALTAHHEFVFSTGSISEALIASSVNSQINSLPALHNIARQIERKNCITTSCIADLDWESVDIKPYWPAIFAVFDRVFQGELHTINYRDSPNAIMISSSLLPSADDLRTNFDILSNARRSMKIDGDTLAPNPDATLLAGVWETQLEMDWLGNLPAVQSQSETRLSDLVQIEIGDLSNDDLNNSVSAAIQRDLDEGYVVLAEKSKLEQAANNELRWWRIDVNTGETLGMTQFGGSVILEAIVATMLIAMTAVSIGLIFGCISEPNNGRFSRCFACLNPVSLGIGVGVMAIRSMEEGEPSYHEQQRRMANYCTS